MTSLSGGSKASARARVTALTMFTQRIWTAVSGKVMPSAMAATTISAWAPLVGRMKMIAFFRLS